MTSVRVIPSPRYQYGRSGVSLSPEPFTVRSDVASFGARVLHQATFAGFGRKGVITSTCALRDVRNRAEGENPEAKLRMGSSRPI